MGSQFRPQAATPGTGSAADGRRESHRIMTSGPVPLVTFIPPTRLPSFNTTSTISNHGGYSNIGHFFSFTRTTSTFIIIADYPAMSSSITIPTRSAYGEGSKAAASSSPSSSYSASPRTPQNQTATASTSPNTKYGHDRRPSLLSKLHLSLSLVLVRRPRVKLPPRSNGAQLAAVTCRIFQQMADGSLGSSLSKQEHTVINIGDPDGVPRLVSHP
jgi:hypothetical protein